MAIQKKSVASTGKNSKNKNSEGNKAARGSKSASAKGIASPEKIINLKPAAVPSPSPKETVTFEYGGLQVSYKP